METYKEFSRKARHEADSIFPILFVDPITTRIAYWLKKKHPKTNPNIITKSRLFFISPAIIICLLLAPLLQMKELYFISAFLFYFIFFTDSLDGQVARGLDKKSKRGAFLDSVADRFGTIIFITMIVSIGLFLENRVLIYGGILLFILKILHLMIITKIYYYKEIWGEKENKSKVFSGGNSLNKIGIGKLFNLLDNLFRSFLPKRCSTLIGGYERYILTFIVPTLLVYFELNILAIWILYLLILLNIIFFGERIKNLF